MKQAKAFVLAVNGGSAGIKFTLFDTDPMLRRILQAALNGSDCRAPRLW